MSTRLPAFVSLASNLNDFGRFADGGPDGNWFVGFNNAWIVKLSPSASGDFTRAFIGAKLGRAKSRPKAGRSWEREPLPGKVYIAISPTPSFSPEQSFFLAETQDIPFEPDPRAYLPGIGQSQWFWAEVPVGLISMNAPNYLIVWSPTEEFTSAANSPILAAAPLGGGESKETRAWLNQKVQGVPPRKPEGTLETPINNLAPALAIKLVPVNDAAVGVNECAVDAAGGSLLFQFSVDAENAQTAWVEVSHDQLDWQRATGYLRQPPYLFTIPQEKLPSRGGYLRGVAKDMLGNSGSCEPVFVSRPGR